MQSVLGQAVPKAEAAGNAAHSRGARYPAAILRGRPASHCQRLERAGQAGRSGQLQKRVSRYAASSPQPAARSLPAGSSKTNTAAEQYGTQGPTPRTTLPLPQQQQQRHVHQADETRTATPPHHAAAGPIPILAPRQQSGHTNGPAGAYNFFAQLNELNNLCNIENLCRALADLISLMAGATNSQERFLKMLQFAQSMHLYDI